VVSGIREEIRQGKPFPNLGSEAMVSLQRTASDLQWRLTEFLKPYGISPTQYNALRILRGAGDDGLGCTDISERMLNRDPDVTRLLDRLVKRGLVRRGRDKRDRRIITAKITDAGLTLLKELDGPLEDLNQKITGQLGRQRLQEFLRTLDLIREKI
jgi:DNA-binding MarR family transcriptional regulator